ncbi:histidine phosphatase family protein [Ktedonospora formicarum]|uniref:Phosphoglycerate mutase n=1 Tax=Ktedonospora formicarum TaxID=2778364 RepID=A0A8J3I0K3_9CHLR|nr:histidine phosphatase family protein [Ktedonospora formicarum]GHO43339.1 phosphoglycerate mutase [Ktedonospora formicarum]
MDSGFAQDPFLMQRTHAAELYLIRHGDAIPDADEIIPSGIYDNLPLSKLGRSQAQALAKRLQPRHFDAAYSSPLRRCLETSIPLLEILGLQATVIENIKEVRLHGLVPPPASQDEQDLTLLTQALRQRQEVIVRRAGTSGSWDTLENSESSKEFRQRVVAALDEIASNHLGERILVFAHGGVINAYVAEVLGMAKDFFFPCANTSLTVVRVSGSTRVLYTLNDIAHLSTIG